MRRDHSQFSVLGVPVTTVTMTAAVDLVDSWITGREPNFVCFRDMHGVMLCQDDPMLSDLHHRAGMVAPDGMPLVWLARLAGYREVGRVSGPDFMLEFCAHSENKGYRHFFFGGREGIAERLAAKLKERFPALQVAGTYTPPFRPLTPDENREVEEMIAQSRADVVWVGISTPKQEFWMSENLGRVRAPVLLGVGAAFDFHAGVVRRAPVWMQKSGLEWLFRLVSEPRRLWRRYLVLGPRFVWMVLLQFRATRSHDAEG